MPRNLKRSLVLLVMCLAAAGAARSQTAKKPLAPDLTKQPTLYVVGYAHLDTEWRWEYPQVIQEYLTKTMRNNFALYEKYPHYIFNFTGANRYLMMKEYYPADYNRLKHYKVEVTVPPEPAPGDRSPAARRARRFRANVKGHGPIIRTETVYAGLKPGYIKRAPVAWFASHNHAADGSNEPYSYSYLFAYAVALRARALTLPDNPRIRVLAITVAEEAPEVHPAQPLYDTLERNEQEVAAMLERAHASNFP